MGRINGPNPDDGVGMKLGADDVTIPLLPLFSFLLSPFFAILRVSLCFPTPGKIKIKTNSRYFTCCMSKYVWASALLRGSYTHVTFMGAGFIQVLQCVHTRCSTRSLHNGKIVVNIIYLDFPM